MPAQHALTLVVAALAGTVAFSAQSQQLDEQRLVGDWWICEGVSLTVTTSTNQFGRDVPRFTLDAVTRRLILTLGPKRIGFFNDDDRVPYLWSYDQDSSALRLTAESSAFTYTVSEVRKDLLVAVSQFHYGDLELPTKHLHVLVMEKRTLERVAHYARELLPESSRIVARDRTWADLPRPLQQKFGETIMIALGPSIAAGAPPILSTLAAWCGSF